jgi:hypothetical protein
MHMPLLSEADPKETSEGSLDPLGLYPLADDLGLKLVPGVRERQSHPRFLTTIAVSAAICQDFDEDTVGKDGASEPWLIFEWLLTEGLVRRAEDGSELVGLPGSQKVRHAVFRDQVPLSAKRYLKTPSVFGFHGVYRLLARTLGIERNGRLWEQGQELLRVWSEEQGLPGFIGTAGGEGAQWRRILRSAVEEGLAKGCIDQSPNWKGWDFFRDHLSVYGVGRREASLIHRLLLTSADGYRRDVLEFLASPIGQKRWIAANDSERKFHASLQKAASPDLIALLTAIGAYETFARQMQDAFDDCLLEMSRQRQRTKPADMAASTAVQLAADSVPGSFSSVRDHLSVINASARFVEQFADFQEPSTVADFVDKLLRHHQRNQRRKPPNGKAPWFERFDDGSYVIRPSYLRDVGGRGNEEYVHAYRTRSLWTFATDIGLVKES